MTTTPPGGPDEDPPGATRVEMRGESRELRHRARQRLPPPTGHCPGSLPAFRGRRPRFREQPAARLACTPRPACRVAGGYEDHGEDRPELAECATAAERHDAESGAVITRILMARSSCAAGSSCGRACDAEGNHDFQQVARSWLISTASRWRSLVSSSSRFWCERAIRCASSGARGRIREVIVEVDAEPTAAGEPGVFRGPCPS